MVKPLSAPGSKNHTPSLGDTFGSAGRRGEQGEKAYGESLNRFAVSAAKHFDSEIKYSIYHSLSIPRGKGDRQIFKGDVDFIVANGNQIMLIDAKLWKPGFYWSLKMPSKSSVDLLGHRGRWLQKHLLGRTIGMRWLLPHQEGKFALSLNMQMALERYRERLPDCTVTAMVAFVPNKRTQGFLNVRLLRWPGDISTYKAATSFEILFTRLGVPEPVNPTITKLLNQMKR